jgi:hypothetical protein
MLQTGEYASARESLLAILEARSRILAREHPDTADTHDALVQSLHYLGAPSEGRDLRIAALQASERSLEKDHPLTGSKRKSLAMLLAETGEYARARELMSRAGAWQELTRGPSSLHALGARRRGLPEYSGGRGTWPKR